jgi:hypothetical protein
MPVLPLLQMQVLSWPRLLLRPMLALRLLRPSELMEQ